MTFQAQALIRHTADLLPSNMDLEQLSVDLIFILLTSRMTLNKMRVVAHIQGRTSLSVCQQVGAGGRARSIAKSKGLGACSNIWCLFVSWFVVSECISCVVPTSVTAAQVKGERFVSYTK